MSQKHPPPASNPGRTGPRVPASLACAAASSLVGSILVAATAEANNAPLGAPTYWPWLLTGLQVVALWAAGGKRWWGWLLGASVQPPWIAYAVATGQLGFIPGCAVSAVIQTYSFVRGSALPARGTSGLPLLEPAADRLKEAPT